MFSFGKSSGSAVAMVLGIGGSKIYLATKIKGKEFLQAAAMNSEERYDAVRKLLAEAGANSRTGVAVVLLKGMFTPVQIDKPKVPEAEVGKAITFAIKDFVQDNVSNLVADYVDMPKSPSYPNDKILVVAAAKTFLKGLCDVLNPMVKITSITCEEVAIAERFDANDEQVSLVLYQPEGNELNMLVYRKSSLFFSRTLRGFINLPKYLPGSLDSDTLDSLSLELQRSIDFLVSQIKITQPKKLTLALDCQDVPAIKQYLESTFGFEISDASSETGGHISFLPLMAVLHGSR